MDWPLVAIGRRLARFPWITTLGLRPNLDDYPPEHQALLRQAQTIYYPTNAFAEMFHSQGKRIFPSLESHLYDGDKIKQTTLLKILGLPHPRTRVFYGRQSQQILAHFSYPFVAKKARGSARGQGVYLIQGPGDLQAYLARHQPAYIQEYLPIAGDVRVVVISFEPVCAYWRLPPAGEFRSNVARGARVEFAGVPGAAVELAVETARLANLDEVGLDVAMHQGSPYVLEFNVKYGHAGPRQAGIDVTELVANKIRAGQL